MELKEFNIESLPNNKFRLAKLDPTEILALGMTTNFEEFKKTVETMNFALEHTEVQMGENKWEKVCELKSANKQLFETDSLKALYSRAEYIKEEIKLLSEKEKTKIRDILLVVAAVAGAATLIISLLASRISMLKTLKKQNETTFTI